MMKWLRSKSYLGFVLIPALGVGMVVGTIPGYRLYEYAWKNPNFCLNCHVHDYAVHGWSQSIHGQKTTCHDCHQQRLRDYLREMAMMIYNPPQFPKDLHHTPYVKPELCSACHLSDDSGTRQLTGPMSREELDLIPKVDLSFLHKVHLNKTTELKLLNDRQDQLQVAEALKVELDYGRTKAEQRPIGCADCHGGPTNRGHNFSAVDLSCARCHVTARHSPVASQSGCRLCHFADFMIPAAAIEALRKNQSTLPKEK